MKKLKLVWTNEALTRLSEIDDYISQDNIGRAQKFVNRLINTQAHGFNLKLLLNIILETTVLVV